MRSQDVSDWIIVCGASLCHGHQFSPNCFTSALVTCESTVGKSGRCPKCLGPSCLCGKPKWNSWLLESWVLVPSHCGNLRVKPADETSLSISLSASTTPPFKNVFKLRKKKSLQKTNFIFQTDPLRRKHIQSTWTST